MGRLTWVEGPAWPGVDLRFSTRAGGVSHGAFASLNVGAHVGDAPEAVAHNRAQVTAALGGEPLWLEQVHGIDVVDADASHTAAPRADAAITQVPGRVLAIMVADCLPVAITNADGTILGAAHAGWKGLAGGVLEQTVQAMRRAQPARTAELRAWIGPAIGPAAFEVGSEVRRAFIDAHAASVDCFAAHADTPGKWWADLPALAEHRLRLAGVTSIVQSGRCTVSEPTHFFSYRRDGQTGRMALFGSLTSR